MHCARLLQRNEENRESSEKRVDTGNADGTGIPAARCVGGGADRALGGRSALACDEIGGSEEVLISCGFLARRKILPASTSARFRRPVHRLFGSRAARPG